jgi:hypothetical protein
MMALGVAVVSYNGHLGFGLTGDFDALPDLDEVAAAMARSVDALSAAAGVDTELPGRFARASTPPAAGFRR